MKVSCILNFNGDIHVEGVNLGNVVNFNPSHDAARERYKGDDFSDSDMTEADFEDNDEEDKGNNKKASGITKLFLPHKRNIPKELKGEKAQQILKSLYEYGILDENFQPVNLSGYQKGYLAYKLSIKLHITKLWKVFSQLWDMNPAVLRTRYNEAISMPSMGEFGDKINKYIG